MSSSDFEKRPETVTPPNYDKKSTDGSSVEHIEKALNLNSNPQARIQNPLHGISRAQLLRDVEAFAAEKDLTAQLPQLRKGAVRMSSCIQ